MSIDLDAAIRLAEEAEDTLRRARYHSNTQRQLAMVEPSVPALASTVRGLVEHHRFFLAYLNERIEDLRLKAEMREPGPMKERAIGQLMEAVSLKEKFEESSNG